MKVGDQVKFKAATRWGCKTVTRKIIAIDEIGRPLVRYGGYSDFVVRLNEIKEIIPTYWMSKEQSKGYTCENCNKEHEYPLYVFAHWREKLAHTCDCGARHSILCGDARLIKE